MGELEKSVFQLQLMKPSVTKQADKTNDNEFA